MGSTRDGVLEPQIYKEGQEQPGCSPREDRHRLHSRCQRRRGGSSLAWSRSCCKAINAFLASLLKCSGILILRYFTSGKSMGEWELPKVHEDVYAEMQFGS